MSRGPRSLAIQSLGVASAWILGAASAARADTPPPPRTSSLAWVRLAGAESCIDMRALARAVELRLGRPAFVAPTRGDLAIEARIAPATDAPGWRATILVVDAAGQRVGLRELQSDQPACHAIDDELELVMALLIDPSAALAPPVAAPPTFTAPPPATIAPVPIALPPPVCPSPPLSSRWRGGAEAGPIAGLGLLPSSVGVGLQLHAHVKPPRGPSFELGSAFWLDSAVRTSHAEPAFSLAYGWLSVCPIDVDVQGSALSACAGVQLGALSVSAPALPSVYHQEELVFSIAAEARLRRRFLGPLLGSFGLGLAVPTVRDRFYFTDPAGTRHDVFQASPIAALLDLGLGIELP
ncbi:MAG: hypothetical protein ABJE95_19855 [Byssovorax sp.]